MKLKVEQTKIIEEGKHEGAITEVEFRTSPFEYTDVVIEFGEGNKIKAGFPTNLTPDSKLGKLLELFGAKIEVGEEIDPADILVGKKCAFMSINDLTERGTFAKVVTGSLKPIQ